MQYHTPTILEMYFARYKLTAPNGKIKTFQVIVARELQKRFTTVGSNSYKKIQYHLDVDARIKNNRINREQELLEMIEANMDLRSLFNFMEDIMPEQVNQTQIVSCKPKKVKRTARTFDNFVFRANIELGNMLRQQMRANTQSVISSSYKLFNKSEFLSITTYSVITNQFKSSFHALLFIYDKVDLSKGASLFKLGSDKMSKLNNGNRIFVTYCVKSKSDMEDLINFITHGDYSMMNNAVAGGYDSDLAFDIGEEFDIDVHTYEGAREAYEIFESRDVEVNSENGDEYNDREERDYDNDDDNEADQYNDTNNDDYYYSEDDYGGCESSQKKISIVNERTGVNFSTLSQKSSNNNCGLNCLFFGIRAKPTYPTIRAIFEIPENTMLNPLQLKLIADKYNITVRIIDIEFNNLIDSKPIDISTFDDMAENENDTITVIPKPIASSVIVNERILNQNKISSTNNTVTILLHNNHYYVVQKVVGLDNERLCKDCNKKVFRNHKCNSFEFKKVNRFANILEERLSADIELTISILQQTISELFINAIAGAGKTYTINEYIQWHHRAYGLVRVIKPKLFNKGKFKTYFHSRVAILATTATAALLTHAQGKTIHRYFGINPKTDVVEHLQKLINSVNITDNQRSISEFNPDYNVNYNNIDALEYVNTIIIDECSMLSENIIKLIDQLLRQIKRNNVRFGGVQMIFLGDINQLPVVKNPRSFVNYIRGSVINIEVSRRFNDESYHKIIQNARYGKIDEIQLRMLATRTINEIDYNDTSKLIICSENEVRTSYNDKFLSLVNGPIIEINKMSFKIGCKVIITRNCYKDFTTEGDKLACVSNGMRCILQAYNDITQTIVLAYENSIIHLGLQENEKTHDFPIDLAYAITIHKAQGMTADKVIFDMTNVNFVKGLAYVAISRVRNLDSIEFINFDKKAFNNYNNTEIGKTLSVEEKLNVQDIQLPIVYTPKKYQNVLENTIMYDIETYTDIGGKLITYSLPFIHYVNGKIIERDQFYFTGTEFTQFLDYILEYIEANCDSRSFVPITICAYNGGKFDHHFLFNALMGRDMDYELSIIDNGGKIISIQAKHNKKVVLQTHDLYLITDRFSLKKCVETFCPDSLNKMAKTYFPHVLTMNAENRQTYIDAMRTGKILRSEEIILTPKDMQNMTPEELIEYTKFINKTTTVDLRSMSIEYAYNDVDILTEAYIGVDKAILAMLAPFEHYVGVMSFKTLTSLTMYGQNIVMHRKYGIRVDNPDVCGLDIYRYPKNMYDNLRSGIYGGRSLPRNNYYKTKNPKLDALCTLDASGMYCFAMINYSFPHGEASILNDMDITNLQGDIDKLQSLEYTVPETLDYTYPFAYFKGFYVLVDVIPNKHDIEPSVAYKRPITKINAKGVRTEGSELETIWSVENRTAWYSDVDIAIMIRNGWKITKIHEGMYWKRSGPILSEWTNVCLQMKEEGIAENNSAKTALGKLMANSLYGAQLQANPTDIVRVCENENDVKNFFDITGITWKDKFGDNVNKRIILKGTVNEYNYDFQSMRSTHLGVYVLAYSRFMLDTYVQNFVPDKLSGNANFSDMIFKGDTDSLTIRQSMINDSNKWLIKKQCGYLTDEPSGSKWIGLEESGLTDIVESIITAPKCYSDKMVKKDGKIENKYRMKGISMYNMNIKQIGDLACSRKKTLSLEEIRSSFIASKGIEIEMPNKFKKLRCRVSQDQKKEGYELFDMKTETMTRTILRDRFVKRTFLYETIETDTYTIYGVSVPLGYECKIGNL